MRQIKQKQNKKEYNLCLCFGFDWAFDEAIPTIFEKLN